MKKLHIKHLSSSNFLLLFFISCIQLSPCSQQLFAEAKIPLDAVVATIDEIPITLHELNDSFSPPRKFSLAEAKRSNEAKARLQGLIGERLIQAEADRRKITISDDDVKHYIQQVAEKNKLTRDEFNSELSKQGISVKDYRKKVISELLKSRIIAPIIRSSATVTESEVEAVAKARWDLEKKPLNIKPAFESITLRQLTISSDKMPKEDFEKIRDELQNEESDRRELFIEKVNALENRTDGGLVGAVKPADLNATILAAVNNLDEGDITPILFANKSYILFYIEEKKESESGDDSAESEDEDEKKDEVPQKLKDEVRAQLEQEKINGKIDDILEKELLKNHTVEKKI